MNQDFILALALPMTLFSIMFSLGTGLVKAQFHSVIKQPKSLITGIISQLILFPILAFILLKPLNLPTDIFIGFMILALSPGGVTSNMFAYLSGGNLPLSISLTAIVSIITPFTIPLAAGVLISFYFDASSDIHLPFLSSIAKLIVVTLIPLSLGMLLRYYKASFCKKHEAWLNRLPMLMLLLVIAGIIHQHWLKMPVFIAQTALPSLLLASLSIFAAYYFARLLKQNTQNAKTIAIETSIQNGGVAMLITGTILNNPEMTIAPVMYGILMLIPMIMYLTLLNFLKTRSAT